jgi:endonuclease YncB( thermonuclease family)
MTRTVPAAIIAAVILSGLGHPSAAQEPCRRVVIGTGTVAAVRDGRTLALDDGREVRLAAIEVADGSRAILQSLAGGHSVRLEKLGPERDRYGRLVALIYTNDKSGDDKAPSVQQTMLEQGQARVSARVGDKACAALLLRAERAARAAHRGLWADPNFAPLRSQDTARISAVRGQFTIVEGKVLSVRETSATIYLNFGHRWTRDFTVTIPKRSRREFADAGVDPKLLEGRLIRIRGWIEQRSGPVLEVVTPEQIELTD